MSNVNQYDWGFRTGLRRGLLGGFVACYLFTGLLYGLTMKHFTPATNALGVAWFVPMWLPWMVQPFTGWEPKPPANSFTFK